MNAADHVRPRQHQEIVVALEVARPIREPLAAIIGLDQTMALDHGAHCAVEDEDRAFETLAQAGG